MDVRSWSTTDGEQRRIHVTRMSEGFQVEVDEGYADYAVMVLTDAAAEALITWMQRRGEPTG